MNADPSDSVGELKAALLLEIVAAWVLSAMEVREGRAVVVRADEVATAIDVVVLGERYSMVLFVTGTEDVLLSVLEIVPFQTGRQDFVLSALGTWSQKWSFEPRTKKPVREALPA